MEEEQKQGLIAEIVVHKDQFVSVDDIRYTVSVAMKSFYEIGNRERQRVLEELIEKVEVHPQQIVVVVKAQKHSSKFEECLEWLPR